jgi:tetratricopeptide (TPR) repeat protein
MIKVHCESCGAPYDVDPRRVPASGLKMRCPGCGATVHVKASAAYDADLPAAKGSALDLDLPAPKGNPAARAHKATQVGLGIPAAAVAQAAAAPPLELDLPAPKPTASGRPKIAPPLDLDADLPAPKAASPKIAPPLELDLGVDLPATKGTLDLPAPKSGAPKIAPPLDLGVDLPATKGTLDLPAPKPSAPAAASSPFDDLADLPAPRPANTAARLAPAFPGAPSSGSPLDDLSDLPAAKPAAVGHRFQRPGGQAVAPKPKAPEPARTSMPKDSLAMDPEPFFDAQLGNARLEKLDELPAQPSAMELDLPAPKADLPQKKFGVPKADAKGTAGAKPAPQGTKLGLGLPAGRLPKDSLDLPSALAMAQAAPAAEPFSTDEPDLPAHADLPQAKRPLSPQAAAVVSELDLPAPNDLPVVKVKGGMVVPGGTAMGIGPTTLPRDSLDLPAPADLPMPKAQAMQPVTGTEMGIGAALGGLDLPAPADLPQVKGFDAPTGTEMGIGSGLDLPAPGDLPRVKLGRDSADLDLPLGGSHAELDLGDGLELPSPSEHSGFDLGAGLDLPPSGDASGLDLGAGLDLPPSEGSGFDLGDFGSSPSRSTFGAGSLNASLDLPPASGDASNSLIDLSTLGLPGADRVSTKGRLPASTMELSSDELSLDGPDRPSAVLPLPGAGERNTFGATGGGVPRGQTMELDGMFELGSSMAVDNSASVDAESFGDLDFGLGAPEQTMPKHTLPKPVPVQQSSLGGFDSSSVEDELLSGMDDVIAPAPTKPKRKMPSIGGISVPGWVWALATLVILGGGGVSLGLFTPHGWFGVYFIEQLLPAAGDPIKVAAAIEQAEKQASSDTYVDVRKSLSTLSDARNEAGLNRELLARSLLHESLYQLRFGEDPNSGQRAVAILSRVLERGSDVKGLTLARAADAARAGKLSEASSLLMQVPKDQDPMRGLVMGEIALLEKRYDDAVRAFTESQTLGAGARASWGLARAQMALGKTAESETATQATLKASPRHASALTRMAELMLIAGKTDEALSYTRKATGRVPIDGIRARSSRRGKADAWALEGEIEEKLDHPREALAAYEEALKVDPLRVSVLLGSGRMLMQLGRTRDALTRFESALSAKPSDTPDMLGRVPSVQATVGAAQAMLPLERAQDALKRVESMLAKFPGHPELLLWKGHALEALEKHEPAEAAFKAAIEAAPTTFSGYVALSQLLFKLNRAEEAARLLSEATGKVEDSAEVRRMLGYSELNRHHLPEAKHHFEAAMRFDPRDGGALFGLATAQRKTGALDAAAATLDRLAAVDASHPGLAVERGQLHEARGDYPAAVAAYRKAIEERPGDTDLKLRLGAALVTAGQVDEADGLLREVLKDRPTSAEAEHYVGRVLFARNDTAQAVQRFERAVSFDPTRPDFYLYLAWASYEQGNLSGALESVKKALDRDPALGDAWWILARIELRTGAVQDALEHLQRTLKLKPGRHEALADMGEVYDQLRKLDEAVAAYEQAVKAVPENGEWWYRLGSLELDRGRRTQARVAISESVLRGDRLLQKPMWVAEAHRLYAEILREENREGEALEHYRMYLTVAPSNARDRAEIERIVKSMQPR